MYVRVCVWSNIVRLCKVNVTMCLCVWGSVCWRIWNNLYCMCLWGLCGCVRVRAVCFLCVLTFLCVWVWLCGVGVMCVFFLVCVCLCRCVDCLCPGVCLYACVCFGVCMCYRVFSCGCEHLYVCCYVGVSSGEGSLRSRRTMWWDQCHMPTVWWCG